MMKRSFGLLAMLLGVLFSSAQAPASSLLWEISGKGSKAPSYLFGTFHMMCRNDFPISDSLKARISNAGQFYGEIAMDDPSLQMQLAMKMMMPDKTLSSLMTDAEYSKISENFQQIAGMPLSMFNNFKPFVAIGLVTLNAITCEDRIQPETVFTEIAKEHHLPILGLETIDDQVNAINAEPLDSQVHALKRILLNFDSVKTMMTQMTAVYKKGNIDTLNAFMKENGMDDDFENALVNKRNHNWIPVMEKAMADKPSFFAVGAGHLGGSEGVISLLRKQGYQVRPVKY